MNEISTDAVFAGRLLLSQPVRGYRSSVDSLLLVWFASSRCFGACADLGCGSGVVGLGLLACRAAREVIGVEIQPRLADLAARNAEANSMSSAFRVVAGDFTDPRLLPGGAFDTVVSNPPFWPVDTGRLPADEERKIACHEVRARLDDTVGAAARLLRREHGRLCVVFPSRRLDDLMVSLSRAGLSPVFAVTVHPRANGPAELVLVEARHGGGGRMEIGVPVALKDEAGSDTDLAVSIVSGTFCEALRASSDKRTAPR